MRRRNRGSRVALVLPAYNEAAGVGGVVRDALRRRVVDTVIVTDDGSTDGTAGVSRAAGAVVVRTARNRGAGAALRDGFAAAARRGCGTIVVMGADAQDRPAEIPRLLKRLEAGYDFVQGSRWRKGGRVVNIPLFRRVTTIVYSLAFSLVSGRRITDGTNGFRAFRTGILRTMRLNQRWLNRYELEPYLMYQAIRQGYRVTEAPVTKWYPARGGAYTKMRPLVDWWLIFRPLVLLSLGLKR